MSAASRFAPRPVATLVDQVADAFEWPRSRPVRLLAGERAQLVARCVVCPSESALSGIAHDDDSAVLCAVPLEIGGGGRDGRRSYDPFVAAGDEDVASWRRSERPVLDAALIISGGRGGVDERLAERCGVEPLAGQKRARSLRPVLRDVQKFVGYVPTDSLEPIREAVFDAGAGSIGDYDRCSWSTLGTGTFRGGEGTDPTIGTRGEFEQVEEVRFETIVPTHLLARVIDAYLLAHPYEEPAFDVFETQMPSEVGFGRIGRLGAGGGQALWNALGGIDPELVVYGRPDQVAADKLALIHTGALRDVFEQVLAHETIDLVVAGSATDTEVDLLQSRDIPLVLVDRSRAVEEFAGDLAGMLSRVLTLPVTVAGSLHFPEADEPGAAAAPVRASSTPDADSVFGAKADFAKGTWRLHFDGGSRGNPGPAAYGWVLYDPDGNEALADGVKVGRTTNNVAEWTGLLRGLEQAAQLGVRRIQVRGDSELVVKQATGVYKVKNETLKPLAAEVKTLLGLFDHYDIKHVYRADNARADEVANEAMDGLR